MTQMSGAEIAIRLLERQGITVISGIPGGANLPLYDALSQSGRIRHILARHEQGAGFIAQGLARSGGGVEVFLATSGPGATNTLTALADAKLDSIPIVCLTGQVPLGMIGTDSFQEVDIYGMSLPVTKHNFLVRRPEELLKVIPEAFTIAASGRPGPVLIDIPKDVQNARIEVQDFPAPGRPQPPLPPDPTLIERAADMINQAERPIFLFGGGASRPQTAAKAFSLIDAFRFPAAMSLQGLGVIPADHELALGMIGMHGARSTNLILEECDLLVVVGSRFNDRATGRLDQFCPGARIIHIDIDAGEVGKLRPAHIGLVADAGLSLDVLRTSIRRAGRPAWLGRVAELKRSVSLAPADPGNPLTPYGIIKSVAGFLAESAIITTDVGQHQMRVAQAFPFKKPGRWLTSGGLGTMGFGLPAAIGAALKHPEATVVCFTGDGSLLMNLQELATAAEVGANIKIILSNNNALGLVQQLQELFYGGRLFGTEFSIRVDFAKIMEGFGIPALKLNQSPRPLEDLEAALRTSGPCLVEVDTQAQDKVFPIVPPGAPNREMIGDHAHA